MDLYENSSVIRTNCSDFEEDMPHHILNKTPSCVLFYADWCGHCQNFKPEYKKFSDKALFINVYALNIDENKSLIESINEYNKENPDFMVKSFPTLWFYKNGEPQFSYLSDRNSMDLLKTAIDFCAT